MQFFIFINGQSVGPMTEDQLWAYNVIPDTSVSTDGVNWRPLYSFPELMVRLRQTPAGAAAGFVSEYELSNKKTLCGIFAIFIGGLGIQYFILGKTGGGIVTILLTLITCGCWSIITLIQGILMLTMSNEDFKRKYVDSPSFMPLF